MSEKEPIYAIPANYTDSGRLFGGMVETRNAVEAGALLLAVGYPEVAALHLALEYKIVVMVATLLPLGVAAVMGVGGDSLLQYAGHVIAFLFRRRKLHYRRIEYVEPQSKRARPKDKKQRRGKGEKRPRSKERKSAAEET